LDENGQLTEDHIHDTPMLTGIPNKVLKAAAKMVENDLHLLEPFFKDNNPLQPRFRVPKLVWGRHPL
jgi:hypothetical protein